MDGMRVITVLEHESVPVVSDGESDCRRLGGESGEAPPWLTGMEAVALLGINDVRPGFCERTATGVRFAQYCGVLRLGGVVIEILPKTGMGDARLPEEVGGARRALLTILSTVSKLRLTAMDLVGQTAVHAPLLEIFVQAFLQCALDQARRGLLFRYLSRADNLSVAKGRFHVHGHIRENLARPHLLHCEFDEFTADNPYNQAVRAALDVCRPWIRTSTGHRMWFEAHARFADISTVRMRASDVAKLRRDRTTRHYEPLLDWCGLLLGLLNPSLRAGPEKAPGLLFDMNRLFEAYVQHIEARDAAPGHRVRTQEASRHLATSGDAPAFTLKPDISVWKRHSNGAEEVIRIVDAKWKRVDPRQPNWNVSESDLYQLLAYAVRYECAHLELVYPAPDGLAPGATHPVFRIDSPALSTPVMVHVRTVFLNAVARLTDA
jgi:5-methylcytosine-specific restriction enzyme subunit McrC